MKGKTSRQSTSAAQLRSIRNSMLMPYITQQTTHATKKPQKVSGNTAETQRACAEHLGKAGLLHRRPRANRKLTTKAGTRRPAGDTRNPSGLNAPGPDDPSLTTAREKGPSSCESKAGLGSLFAPRWPPDRCPRAALYRAHGSSAGWRSGSLGLGIKEIRPDRGHRKYAHLGLNVAILSLLPTALH